MARLRKKGQVIDPVMVEGRKIAHSFWGEAWCNHLEAFSDYANRLPRGRTYVRNGSVVHLGIQKGRIDALVSGSSIYRAQVTVKPLAAKRWSEVKNRCTGRIGSLLDLLEGRLSEGVMGVVTDPDHGLFPRPREIKLACSCPDWATMCKHVAAVLYGVGARLDERPELLFLLRGVDHEELIATETGDAVAALDTGQHGPRLASESLEEIFGLELVDGEAEPGPRAKTAREPARKARKTSRSRNVRKKQATQEHPAARRQAKKRKPARKKTAAKEPIATPRCDPQPTPRPATRAGGRRVRVVKGITAAAVKTAAARSARRFTPRTARGNAKRLTTQPAACASPAPARKRSPTARGVARLRARFGMSPSQFARLLGVSSATIHNWEKAAGRLALQTRTRNAWDAVAGLDRRDAWTRLRGT